MGWAKGWNPMTQRDTMGKSADFQLNQLNMMEKKGIFMGLIDD